jgi:2-polyprenyl-3-methyl-5-hydroxy-6-metoxy-1,4-benzoquinol methylase
MEYPVKIVPNPRPLFYFKKGGSDIFDNKLHEQIGNIINKIYPDHAIRILDIASGDNRLALRIRESRNKKFSDDIVTVDIIDPVEPLEFTYWQIDLNDQNQLDELVDEYRGYFDLILGVETIEYIENPKMYLYYLREMLNDNGHIFISLSNISNPESRRIFYKTGKFKQFSDQTLKYSSIILPSLLEKMAGDLKLKLMIEYPIGVYPKFWLYLNKRSLYVTFCNLCMLRVKGSLKKLYIFKKDD